MNIFFSIINVLLLMFIALSPAKGKEPIHVATSIKPIHSLAAGVMEGVGTPYLIMKKNASPHTYTMKPSDIKAIQKSKLVFWISEKLEKSLSFPLRTIGRKAKKVPLIKVSKLNILPFREEKEWEVGIEHSDHHDHGNNDLHIWLDPQNAKLIVLEVVKHISLVDPENKNTYEKNGKKMIQRLDQLTNDLEKILKPIENKAFVVFHDSFQYFEKRFGLNTAGVITLDPEHQIKARHLVKIRNKIKENKIQCIFSEPQFNPKVIKAIASETKAKISILDPHGANIPDGPDLYFTMMTNNAKALKECLQNKS